MKGTYILVIYYGKANEIKIGALGNIFFSKGYYFYVGSGMGAIGSSTLLNRVKRHLLNHKEKSIHWHIDYLLADKMSFITRIYLIPSIAPLECKIAQDLASNSDNIIDNFGSSDCSCKSHLIYFANFTELSKIFQ
ncbi:MAG: DUF123 domain-containing protein [Promethearchaeota archaeon]